MKEPPTHHKDERGHHINKDKPPTQQWARYRVITPGRSRIQGNCLCIQIAQSQFGATAPVAPVELQVPMELEELPRVVAKQAL